ncbi:hypothetical protein NQ318_007500 [Aromia moschata]|uniref:RNA-directed DNA polymerase n=1 Tax=Aromia moschata TaxID=1265417 RepID=A0AAV8YFX4_9CUCU|nr:hypothetical protein NQ318_007500 [Aromia moschata]
MQFRCAHWERFLRRSNISGYFSPIYYQRANPVERRNQGNQKILRAQILDQPPAQWDERLDDISFAINNRRNAATGLPPSHLLLGAPLTRPGNQQHPNVLRPAANDAQARADRVRHARVHHCATLRPLNMEYHTFRQRFVDKYDSSSVRRALQAQLYGQKQGEKEDTTVFISRKVALFRRLAPDTDEVEQVLHIRDMLRAELRMGISPGIRIDSVDRLVQLATAYEGDLKEYQQTHRPATTTKAPTATGGATGKPQDYRRTLAISVTGIITTGIAHRGPPWRTGATSAGKPLEGRSMEVQETALDTINTASRSNLPRIPTMLGEKRLWSLIDTGASGTFVNRRHVPDLEGGNTGPRVLLADGNAVCTEGPYAVTLNLCGYLTEADIYTLDGLSEDIILGQDWLQNQNATIDYPRRCLYFGHRPRASVYWDIAIADELLAEPVTLTAENVADELRPPRNARRRPRRREKSGLSNCFRKPSTGALNLLEAQDEENEPLYQEVQRVQAASPEYQATRDRWQRLRTGEEAADTSWKRTLRDDYTVHDGLIWHTKDGAHSLVVPLELWPRVIFEFHASPLAAHPGRDETIRAAKELYYWPAMTRQIKTHVRHCIICASTKHGGAHQPNAPLRPRPPTRPWQTLGVDIMGPYAESRTGQNRFLLTATDTFSKWTEVRAVPRATGRVVKDFVRSVCLRWGYPETIITDNGGQFKCAVWNRFLRLSNITGYFTPVYHQRANSVERRNQEIKKVLRAHLLALPPAHWDERLDELMFALNNRRNAATGQPPPGSQQHPNVLRPPRNDPEARADRVRQAHAQQQQYQEAIFPEPRDAQVHYRVGQHVLTRFFYRVKGAIKAPWEGPHLVTAVLGNGVYEVQRGESRERVHVDDIRPALGPAPDPREDIDIVARQPPGGGPEDPVQEEPLEDEDLAPEEPSEDEDPVQEEPSDDEDQHVDDDEFQPAAATVLEERPSTSPQPEDITGIQDRPEPPHLTTSAPLAIEVLVEDCQDEEDEELRGSQDRGVPIVGLWP